MLSGATFYYCPGLNGLHEIITIIVLVGMTPDPFGLVSLLSPPPHLALRCEFPVLLLSFELNSNKKLQENAASEAQRHLRRSHREDLQ